MKTRPMKSPETYLREQLASSRERLVNTVRGAHPASGVVPRVEKVIRAHPTASILGGAVVGWGTVRLLQRGEEGAPERLRRTGRVLAPLAKSVLVSQLAGLWQGA